MGILLTASSETMVEMMVTPVTTSLEHPGEETQWRLKESASFCNCLQVNKQTKATTNNTHTKKNPTNKSKKFLQNTLALMTGEKSGI